MPRDLLRAPGHNRDRSLGWLAIAWMEYFCVHGPGQVKGMPVVHGDEYTFFVVDCYAIGDHPSNNHMLYDSAFLSRPKGCDKSGLGARLALFEALGPCRFAGWAKGGEVYEDPWGLGFRYVYQPGEPMGKRPKAPLVRCMATEINQVGNVYETILYNLNGDEEDVSPPPLSLIPGIQAGLELTLLPGSAKIRRDTASASAKDGGKETFVVFDESHLYDMPELRAMYRTVTRNLRKRKKIDGTWYIETTTMFRPGSDSVAELTYNEADLLREGRKKHGRWRLMYDHRWGECKKLSDEAALRAALIEAYGDAMEWMDLDSLVDDFYDSRNEEADSRRYFLNARTSAADAWLREYEWAACKRPGSKSLQPGDFVTLGLDGGRTNDATALVAVRIEDMHVQLLDLWERPEDAPDDWAVDPQLVHVAVAKAMSTYKVAGFYADPPYWQSYIDVWTNEWGHLMQVVATRGKPLEWWTNRERATSSALERFHSAVLDGLIGYTPWEDRDPDSHEGKMIAALRRHILNARRAPLRGNLLLIRKEHHKSKRKIDAAMAAVLAFECASDAVAQGVKPQVQKSYVPKRIR